MVVIIGTAVKREATPCNGAEIYWRCRITWPCFFYPDEVVSSILWNTITSLSDYTASHQSRQQSSVW